MKEENHWRAKQLIDVTQLEGLSAADRAWLDEHLQNCASCRELAQATARAIQSLRSVLVGVNPALVSKTQIRVHLRAQELREQQARMRTLWVSCALSWVLGAVSAPLLWQGFEWLGRRIALPEAIWITAFALWWLTPAVVVGTVLAWQRSHASSETGHAATTPR